MRLSRRVWWLYLALMTPVSITYLVGPLNAGPVFNVIGFSASIAIIVGVRINKPATRWPWYLIAAGQALLSAGDVLAYNYKAFFGTPLPFPSIADPLYLLVYPTTIAGLMLLIRKRNPGRDWTALVDAVIVAIGLALLSWIFLMAPYAHDPKLSFSTKLVAIAYPLGDILLVGVGARLAVGAGRRSRAYYLMVSGIGAVLITDSMYGWIQLHGTYHPGDPLDAGWIVYYLLLGAAALHPSMNSISAKTAPKIRLTRARIIGISAAALIAPVTEMLRASGAAGSDAFVIGGAATVLFGLVVARMIGLARVQEATAERERLMREASDALATATSRHEIIHAAQDAATSLTGTKAMACVFGLEHRGGARCLVAERCGEIAKEVVIELAALPEALVGQLIRRGAVDIPDAQALFGRQSAATPAFMAPFLVQGQLEGAVSLLDASTASVALRRSLEVLASQVGLGLESAALTEAVLRSETDAHFSALVEHSADVIFVLNLDTTIQYASPSVEHMLGYRANELIGRRLTDYVPVNDRSLTDPDGRLPRFSDASEALEFRVRHSDGRWLDTESSVTNLMENPAVRGVVVNLRDVTERKQIESQLAYQAFHDPVTGLANRALFCDRLEHALSRRLVLDGTLAVLFLDLDNFKSVNDAFGRLAGDWMLRTISARLKLAVRGGDTVARIGGDEFAILLEDVEHETRVSEVAEHLLDVVRAPLSDDGREVSIRCSLGIAIASATVAVGSTVAELLRNSDVAMYEAKHAGGDTHRYFAPEMHESLVEQLELRAELKAAVERYELTLAYQPIFDLKTDEISGYEALLRWEHKERGAVSPAVFIPVAEASGLIVPLGRWILNRACNDAVAFQRACPDERERTISVNLSARQLQRPEIVDEVRDALRVSGLDPGCLVLEITESMMINDLELAIARLQALRELGVLVAVDDFGTGYSSLNYIRRLPINILKIDKSFIDSVDADDQQSKLTAAIIGLGRVLDLQCVAEGVERSEQHERLKELNCDYAQGFLLARPMSGEALTALLRGGERSLAVA